MRKNEFILFRTNVSLDSYTTKEEAFICVSNTKKAKEIGRDRMAFKERVVTVKSFLRLATSGHCFCNLFDYNPAVPMAVKKGNRWINRLPVYERGSNKGGMKPFVKCNKNFKGAQTVFVDIDYTRFQSIPDYLSTLSIPPTCVYMSFSDNKPKDGCISRRFRMVYVFDKILSREEFVGVSRIINDTIIRDTGEPMDDDCGTRMSQYMNGVFGNSETYVSNYIYSVTDFPGWEKVAEDEEKEIEFDDYMCYQMEHLGYDEFMHKNSWRGYYYRTERPDWEDGLYQLTDENYLAIWFPRETVKDGHKRRRKLYYNACLRVLMFPGITPDVLLFNLYVDMVRFFDYSDHVITLDCLKRRAKRALNMPRDILRIQCQWYIDYWRENRPLFIVRKGIRTTQGVLQIIQKIIRYKEIDAVYNRNKSVQKNIEAGIGIPQATLYRFCIERGIPTDPARGMTKNEKREKKRLEKENNIKLFKLLYEPSLSVRDNQKKMMEHGLALSRGTISNFISKYFPKVEMPILEMPTYTIPMFGSPMMPSNRFVTDDSEYQEERIDALHQPIDLSFMTPPLYYPFVE